MIDKLDIIKSYSCVSLFCLLYQSVSLKFFQNHHSVIKLFTSQLYNYIFSSCMHILFTIVRCTTPVWRSRQKNSCLFLCKTGFCKLGFISYSSLLFQVQANLKHDNDKKKPYTVKTRCRNALNVRLNDGSPKTSYHDVAAGVPNQSLGPVE